MKQVKLKDFDGTARGLAALREPLELTSYGHVLAVVAPPDYDWLAEASAQRISAQMIESGVPEGYEPAVDDFGNQYLSPKNVAERILEPARARIKELEGDVERLRVALARTQRTPSRRELVEQVIVPTIQPAPIRGPVGQGRFDTQPMHAVPKPKKKHA